MSEDAREILSENAQEKIIMSEVNIKIKKRYTIYNIAYLLSNAAHNMPRQLPEMQPHFYGKYFTEQLAYNINWLWIIISYSRCFVYIRSRVAVLF